jgi:hypothetical protein
MQRRTLLKRIGATGLASSIVTSTAAADAGTQDHEECHIDDCSDPCPCDICYC